MALDDRWNSRIAQDQASKFLRTGSTQGIYNPQVVGAPRAGCGDSRDCASGWYCSGGYCKKKSATGTANGTPYSEAGGGSSAGSGGGGSTCDGSELTPGDIGQTPVADGSGGDTGCGGGSLSPCAPGPGDVGNLGGLGGNSGGGGCGTGAMGGGGMDFGDDPSLGGFGGDGAPGSCQNNSCGEDPGGEEPDPDGGAGTSVLNPGPNGGAGGDCCGVRCCRYSAAGRAGISVQCYCGPCPPPQRCDKYCAAYSANFGGTAPGCPQNLECDECTECVEFRFWAFCEPKKEDAPCHCGTPNSACADCEVCNDDGTCEPDCVNCEKKVTLEVACEGGCTRKINCYVSPCEGESAQCELDKCTKLACEREPCSPEYCAPTITESSQSCNPGLTPPPCPDGLTRSGTIEIGRDPETGGALPYAYSCSICSKTTENKDCRCTEPCNCHSDCGDCQKCGPDGCYPDPACPDGASGVECPAPVQPGADPPEPPPEP